MGKRGNGEGSIYFDVSGRRLQGGGDPARRPA